MWPNARISVMGGEQASSVLATVKRDGIEAKGGKWSAEEEAAFKQPLLRSDVAQRAHQRDGRRAGVERTGDGEARRHRGEGRQVERGRRSGVQATPAQIGCGPTRASA